MPSPLIDPNTGHPQPPHSMHDDTTFSAPFSALNDSLQCRSADRHHPPLLSPKTQWTLAAVLLGATLAWALWALAQAFPSVGWQDAPGIGRLIWQKVQKISWLQWLFPLLWLLSWSIAYAWPRSLRLQVSAEGIDYSQHLPLGLHHLFGQRWHLSWSDLQAISVRQPVDHVAISGLTQVELVFTPKAGRVRRIQPSFWFRPEDPPRQRLQLPKASFRLTAQSPWLRPESQAVLAQAFDALPAVQAVNRFGAAYGHRVAWPDMGRAAVSFGLSRQPEVQALLGAALLVLMGGLALMVAQPTLHLHAAPGWIERLALALISWLLVATGLWAWRQRRLRRTNPNAPSTIKPPEPLHRGAAAFTTALWLVAVSFTAEPWLVHASHWGRSDWAQTARYKVDKGQAIALTTPISQTHAHTQRAWPVIELPGSQSRLAWIRDGSETNLTLIPGRWGLWVYDDQPLRQLADEQGVQ